MLKTCAVADCGSDCICGAMNIVTKILADAGGEICSSLARPDTLPGYVDVVPQDAPEDAETRKNLRALHEALTVRREMLVERRTYTKYWFNQATSSFTIPSSLQLLIQRSSELGKAEGALKEVKSLLDKRTFVPLAAA